MSELVTVDTGFNFNIARSETFEDMYVIYHAPFGEYAEEFVVFKIECYDEAGVPHFWEGGTSSNFPGTPDPSLAEPALSGSIKWDGCSNWDFHCEDGMIHYCGVKMATSIGRLMERLYDIAAAAMGDKFDRELAGMPPLIDGEVVGPRRLR